MSTLVPGAISPSGISLRDHRGDQVGFGRADPGALEHAFEAVAARQRRLEVEARAFGRAPERDDRGGRAHAAAAVAAERERHDHLAAEFVAHRIVDHHQRRGLDRREAGPAGQRDRRKAEQRAGAAQPAARADVLREVGHEVERGEPRRSALAPFAVAFGEVGDALERRARSAARRARSARATGAPAGSPPRRPRLRRSPLILEQTRPPVRSRTSSADP